MPVGEQRPDGLDEPIERAAAVHAYRQDGVGVRKIQRLVFLRQKRDLMPFLHEVFAQASYTRQIPWCSRRIGNY